MSFAPSCQTSAYLLIYLVACLICLFPPKRLPAHNMQGCYYVCIRWPRFVVACSILISNLLVILIFFFLFFLTQGCRAFSVTPARSLSLSVSFACHCFLLHIKQNKVHVWAFAIVILSVRIKYISATFVANVCACVFNGSIHTKRIWPSCNGHFRLKWSRCNRLAKPKHTHTHCMPFEWTEFDLWFLRYREEGGFVVVAFRGHIP